MRTYLSALRALTVLLLTRTALPQSRDVMARWTYPGVPDRVVDAAPPSEDSDDDAANAYTVAPRGVYVQRGALISPGAHLGPDVVIASGARIEEGAVVTRSTVGAHCSIGMCSARRSLRQLTPRLPGKNAVVSMSHLWPGTQVAANVCVTGAILGEKVTILAEATRVPPGCILASGVRSAFCPISAPYAVQVVIGPGARLGPGSRISPVSVDDVADSEYSEGDTGGTPGVKTHSRKSTRLVAPLPQA